MTRIRSFPTCRRGTVAFLAVFVCVACGSAPATRPAAPTEASAPAPPVAPIGNAATAPHYLCAADYSERHAGRSLLILRGGDAVFETGQNGHPADGAQALGGASQGFWGLAAVAAEADGLLDLDEPAAFTVTEFDTDPGKREIRLRQLLHQTSGLEPGVAALRRETTADLSARALSLELIAPPGTRFQHGPSHAAVFNEVLRRKLAPAGEQPDDYLRARILEPIGMSVESWARDASGNLDAAYGATVRPRQWARLGQLLADGGRAGNRDVLTDDAVATLLEGSRQAPEFAFGLWRNPAEGDSAHAFYPGGLPDLVVAAGEGNQRLYVIPSLELVVVRTGDSDRGWRDREFLDCLVRQPEEVPTGEAAGSG